MNANAPYRVALDALRRQLVADALAAAHGNAEQAALALGISRPHIYWLIVQLGIGPQREGRRSS